jgi:uncharacterized coiled-coil DUF342 family protein
MSNFHNRMVNIQIDPESSLNLSDDTARQLYKLGHRDARHGAAQIANEADSQIEDLQRRVGRLEGANVSLREQRDKTQKTLDHVADDRDQLALKIQEMAKA